MDCREARTHLLDRRRGTLPEAARALLEEHLRDCAACRGEDAADGELSAALERGLPRARAPGALRREVEARWAAGGEGAAPRARGGVARVALAMAAGAALALLVVVAWRGGRASPDDAMVTEAVNDHLRVLYREHPLEVESGGIHQVKPWFEGRVDFAPVVPFGGDDDFPLQGGAVAYFLDRKAAEFVFKRRLHVVSLFVFPSQGLPWPAVAAHTVGAARGTLTSERGFHVLLWRKGDLGYALVSDVDEHDLDALGAKIDGG
jgi:anti-sigma factor RsiW